MAEARVRASVSRSLTVQKVRSKVRETLEKYPELVENDINEETKVLTCKSKFTKRFFCDVMQPGHEALRGIVRDSQTFGVRETFEHSLEFEKAYTRVEDRVKKVANLRIRLVVFDLDERNQKMLLGRGVTTILSKIMGMDYGLHRTALVIEDMVLEWGSKSLIIPRKFHEQQEGAFVAKVHQYGNFYQKAARVEGELRGVAGRTMDYIQQLHLFSDLAAYREGLLSDLVEVIVGYNGTCHYNTLTCSSQHFVRDALTALEISNDFQFGGQLGTDFKQLKQGRRIKNKCYGSHEEVDRYVEAHVGELTRQELEHLNLVYTHLHRESKERSQSSEEWVCPGSGCKTIRERLLACSICLPEFATEPQ